MRAININPELKSVTEKHMGLDWLAIFGLMLAVAMALVINFCLPIDETLKGVLSMIVAAPIVLVSIKDFYGLRSYRLALAVILWLINRRHLIYRSEGIWKELNKYAGSGRKKYAENEKDSKKHTTGNARM